VRTETDEVDLAETFGAIWAGRWVIASIVLAFAVCAAVYLVFAQTWYKSEVVLAPVSQKTGTGGTLAGLGLGGLAGLAGISLPGAGDPQVVAVLRSREFAREFIEDLNLVPVLLEGVRAERERTDIRTAVQYFDRHVRAVVENSKTRMVTLSVRWKNPETAALWANVLAKRLNDRLRERAAQDAERNITYLRKELAATSVISLQRAMGDMLETQMQDLMLARGHEEYALRVIDSAVPSIRPESPKKLIIMLVSILAGGVLATFIVIFRYTIGRRARQ
jgi:uncharacterized protein involved in exopolysaccharide biosynthesis